VAPVWELDRIHELPLPTRGLIDTALWTSPAGSPGCPPGGCSAATARRSRPTPQPTTFADVKEYLDVADQCLALGYCAIKLHAWGDPRRDA